MAWGLCSERNDDPDSLTAHATFRTIGANDIVVESDDGTTDKDDIATGQTLLASWKRCVIDFSAGIVAKQAPSLSVGGKADVQFFVGDAYGKLRRVASGTPFDMSAYSAGLQPYLQIQKTSDSNTDALSVLEVAIHYKMPC